MAIVDVDVGDRLFRLEDDGVRTARLETKLGVVQFLWNVAVEPVCRFKENPPPELVQ